MNICSDIDDTITENPEFFSLLTKSVKLSGGKVFIVTSRTPCQETYDVTRKELEEYGIVYDHLWVLDDRQEAEKKCPHSDLDWYEKYLFQKVAYCKTNKVNVFFDDEMKVVNLFRRFLSKVTVFRSYPNPTT